RDPTEAPPSERVGDLLAERLVAEPVAVLEVHQPQIRLDRDRRTSAPRGQPRAKRRKETANRRGSRPPSRAPPATRATPPATPTPTSTPRPTARTASPHPQHR